MLQGVVVSAEAVEAAAHFPYYDIHGKLSHFPVCCSVLQCVAVCCSVSQCVAVCCSAVCCSVLQCVAVCCSVLQCVAVRCVAE